MCKWTVCALLLIGLFFDALGTIIIKEITGTETAQFGTNNTLTCDFVFKDETGVEVKWFFNDNKQIVSWIPTRNKPQAIGDFKSVLDFSDSLINETSKSVIRFKELTFDLTGRYTCKVSGNEHEESETHNMIVYQPASSVEFIEEGDAENITCSAYDVYPLPNITITGTYATGRDDSIRVLDELDNITITDDNYYNVSKTIVLDKSKLNRTIVFTCNVFIPETAFNETAKVTIVIESYESTTEYPDYSESSTIYLLSSFIPTSTEIKRTISTTQGNSSTSSTSASLLLSITVLLISLKS